MRRKQIDWCGGGGHCSPFLSDFRDWGCTFPSHNRLTCYVCGKELKLRKHPISGQYYQIPMHTPKKAMDVFLHAWFDDGKQSYPVVWDGKQWNSDKDKRRVYKRQAVAYQIRDRFSRGNEQLDHNIHSVEVWIAH